MVQPLLCSADSATATTCAALWTDWEREILGTIDPARDAGTPGAAVATDAARETDANSGDRDAHAEAGADGGPPGKHGNVGCGCHSVAANTVTARETAWWLLAGLLSAGLWQRDRQRQRTARTGS